MNYEDYVGNKIKVIRDCTTEEWGQVNSVPIKLGTHKIEKYQYYMQETHLFQLPGGNWYPCCCFELEPIYELY